MEPKNKDNPSIIYINVDKSVIGDNELLSTWLSDIIAQAMYSNSDDDGNTGLTVLQELEYIDSTVVGDEHPDAIEMIMSAYNKFK